LARFLDVHSFTKINQSVIRNLQGAPPDEFGVKQLNVLITKLLISAFVFLKLQAENRWKNIMKNIILNVIGSQKYKR
jgi:hypothetical protein